MSKTVLFGGAGAYPTAANPTLLAAGEIGVYSVSSTGAYSILANAAAVNAGVKALPIMIAQGGVTGGNFKSVMIYPGGIVSVPTAATSYAAPVPNVDIVGFSGGTDTNTILADLAGTYNLTATNTSKTAPPLPFNMASSYYSTTAAAISFQVAYDWAKAINAKTLNTSLQPYDRFVFADVLTNQASTQWQSAVTPANITATLINGSKTVTLTFATGTLSAPQGSYLRIGHATTDTHPVYKIAVGGTVTTGGTITLDTPYVNPSLAIGATISTVALGLLTAAPVKASLAGVRLVSYGNWFNGSAFKELYPNYSIAVGVSGTGPVGTPIVHNGVVPQSYLSSTGVVTTGVAKVGYGVGWQAQKQEYEAQGYQGNTNRSWLPYPVQYFASATTNYDGYAFNYRSFPTSGGANDGNYKSEIHECVIFCTTPATDSGDILDSTKLPAILAAYI